MYDWLAEAAKGDERWDVVFCSYGAICWLSDLTTWAKGIAAVLKPGGRFVTVEFHPVAWMFDEDFGTQFPYSTHGKPMTWDDGVGDYVAQSGPRITPSGWEDGVQDFRNPHRRPRVRLGRARSSRRCSTPGSSLEHFREYDYEDPIMKDLTTLMRCRFPDRRFTLPDGKPSIPLLYSITARKP